MLFYGHTGKVLTTSRFYVLVLVDLWLQLLSCVVGAIKWSSLWVIVVIVGVGVMALACIAGCGLGLPVVGNLSPSLSL